MSERVELCDQCHSDTARYAATLYVDDDELLTFEQHVCGECVVDVLPHEHEHQLVVVALQLDELDVELFELHYFGDER